MDAFIVREERVCDIRVFVLILDTLICAVVRALAARELTKIVAALRDVVEPVKAVAATVDVCDVRPITVDVRVAVEM